MCQRHRYQQPKEPLRPHDKPQEPWRKVGMDLFQLKGKDYQMVMDYHSNYPEFAMLSDNSRTGRDESYNRTAKPLGPLAHKDMVRVRCDGQWGPLAKVIKETTPRSYEVITEHCNTLRRNTRHLLKVPYKDITMDTNNEVTSSQQSEQPDMSNLPV
ncbi:hypothetical protein SKAU_G00234780 [Synaphobranchus kaupii]|uniref:Uncharacterized protein n=1 Tax=Synaphobranchus kaupii TaxID=118154 RepID=A0A9Q1ITB1_SYNKA|nr:hypothetical protein SKAU_G00234780 [Synaphobranchus kaupii]